MKKDDWLITVACIKDACVELSRWIFGFVVLPLGMSIFLYATLKDYNSSSFFPFVKHSSLGLFLLGYWVRNLMNK